MVKMTFLFQDHFFFIPVSLLVVPCLLQDRKEKIETERERES